MLYTAVHVEQVGCPPSHFKDQSATSRAGSICAEYRFIGIRALDFRLRQGIQALETHLLLPEDLVASDVELRALLKSTRLLLG